VSQKKDYYEILGVPRGCDAAELKRAYRKLAMEHHPDRNPDNHESENRFKEASEAYQVLSDPEKRQLYDRFGHDGPGRMGGQGFGDVGDIFSAFGDIFGDIFGQRGGGGGRRGPARGADVETSLVLTLLEASTGVKRDVEVTRRVACGTCKGSGAAPGTEPEVCQQCGGRGQVMHSQGFLMIQTTCPVCRGNGRVIRKACPTCDGQGFEAQEETLQVTIPAGVEDGSTLRLANRGEAGVRGGPAGNLFVVLRVQEDERFERNGTDLHTEVSVSFPQMALGGRVKVPTLTGEAEVDVRGGSQPGDTVTLRGQGMPSLEGRGHGDIVAHFKLVVPKAMSAEEEQHLRAFAQAGGEIVAPEKHGIFGRKKKK
jgi:molecular chaperone DnaJ